MNALDGKNPSQRAAIAVNMMLEAKDSDPEFSARRMASELSSVVGTSRTYINDAWRVRMRDPRLFTAIEAGEISVWKAERIITGKAKSPKVTRLRRAEQIGQMASEGYRSIQISELLGISDETVRHIARKFGIALPDAKIGRTRKIDARRVIEHTVSGLEGYAMGVQTIIGTDINMAAGEAKEMAASIRESIRPLNRLCQKLTEIANGKTA